MKNIQITPELARRIALHAQLLDGSAEFPAGKEGVARIIEQLGYVQIDTIAVIERAHHHTLQTRAADYDAVLLHDLQANDRRVFEYWGHAMSYLPMRDYRYYLPRMQQFAASKSPGIQRRLNKCGHLLQPILERIRQEGPVTSKDFEALPQEKGGAWWDWKPSKIALELLFWRGEIMVTERRKFQKVYDLTERVLPEGTDTRMPSDAEVEEFRVRRALSAYGIARAKDIHAFLQLDSKNRSKTSGLTALVEAGEVIPLTIRNRNGAEYYTLPATLEQTDQFSRRPATLHFLSPFDNLIIRRERVQHLFDFDFALECYLPAKKRTYGYFLVPMLWGDRFVGRFDPKADRKSKTLILRNLVFEPDFQDFETFLPIFGQKLREFARFNQCDTISIEKSTPRTIPEHCKDFF
ncbi:hypothetical protein U27_00358 [Candidatus Vecturithrix granuli]|uniref:Cytoplasmic protein n=1 Tax=Vecturithrix granuli TaxID=1499967 RepID=A0A081C7A6_VECG1|nr:hypothetical protein U27_00358 [Candidatus Vecturithrix granuli]